MRGVLSKLWLTAAGWFSPSKTATPASTSANIVINPQFDWADSFSEGLAAVSIGDKFGYIDNTGHIIINPQFDGIGSFSDGLAMVRFGGKEGYIAR